MPAHELGDRRRGQWAAILSRRLGGPGTRDARAEDARGGRRREVKKWRGEESTGARLFWEIQVSFWMLCFESIVVTAIEGGEREV